MSTARIAMWLQPALGVGIACLLSSASWGAELPPTADGTKIAAATMPLSTSLRPGDAAAVKSAIERPLGGLVPLVTPAIHASTLPPNACRTTTSTVCYDYEGARAVFVPGKQFMPNIPGMTAEHLSVRHDKVVLSYSF